MKEHGSKLPAEQPAKILKSLLKKPGQSKSRSHKNRVVINEKLNEFFAADYIILIKEECCADYEEDCDCCCQEHELIRLGNCKECRAELNLHFGVGDGGRYHDVETENSKLRRDQVCTGEPFGCVELHLEDEDEEVYEVETEGDEDEVEEEEAATKYEDQAVETNQVTEERTGDLEEGTEEKQAAEEAGNSTKNARGKKKRERVDNETDTCEKNVPVSTPLMLASPPQPSPPPPPPLPPPPTPPPPPPPPSSSPPPAQPSSPASSSQEHQQETLSPPEGYKDVYSNEKPSNVGECCLQASSLDYLHCEGSAGTNVDGEPTCFNEDTKNNQDEKTAQNNEQQLQRTASTESRHRYLVETITMTTVTERRIVREISEEEEKERVVVDPQEERRNFVSLGKTTTIDDQDTIDDNDSIEYVAVKGEARRQRQTVVVADARGARETRKATEQPFVEDKLARHESTEAKDLSLVFKLGNSSLTGNNSLKPNSAVRQLFPNPKFVSPPPAPPAKLISSANSIDNPENNSVLFPNTENLRLFDNTMSENQDYSSNDESNPIRRTIERNTLRRSLLDKYRANSRKKSLPSKNLSLEERIRQLTCVDQEDDEDTSQRLSDTENTSSVSNKFDDEMLVRAAPPGQEDTRTLSKSLTRSTTTDTSTPLSASTVHVATQFGTLYGTLTAATTATSATTLFAPNSSSTMTTTAAAMAVAATTVTSSNYYKQISSAGTTVVADHLHNQSTYKKLTELFVHKKNIQPNMPDLGLGNGGKNGCKDYQARNSMKANNSDTMRRQFLASLAPLSCVAVNSADSQEDYYRHNSRMMVAENRGSTYNTAGAYNLDNIETNLHQDDGNYINIGPPDVTKGTSMILDRPDIGDSTTDELLAFVEQDRFRTERIKRRYNDDQYHLSTNGTSNYISDSKNEVSNDHQQQVGPTYRDNNGNKNRSELQRVYNGTADNNIDEDDHEDNDKGNDNDNDDDDDELNDYGFNRRPSVTGIKQQRTDSGDESFHRPSLDNDNTNIPRTNFHPSMPTYYENNCIKIDSRIALYDETIDNSTSNSFVGTLLGNERNASTINRINTMQKQIDDIYQTIVENTNVTPQNTMEREPYAEEAFARQPQLRLPINDPTFRFYQEQRNSQQYFQEQLNATNVRTSLRGVAVGAEEIGTNGLAAKTRRTEPRTVTTPSNYHCNVVPTVYTGLPANTKCYRTMYFVPYNGLSDPTYQNIQRILPSHPSPSYASHIERYPYPRSSKNDQLQTQTQTQPPSTPQLRYYHVGNRSLSPISNLTQANHASSVPQATLGHSVPPDTYPPFSSANPPVTLQPTQQTFHLHLHHHQQQPEDFRISGVAFHHQHQHQLQVQHQHQHHPHHRHHHQPMFYRLPSTIPPQPPPASSTSPSSSSYAVRFAGNGVATTESSYRFYQVHLGRAVVTPPTELQNAQTFSSSTTSAASYSSSLPSSASYSSSLSSSFSSLPTATSSTFALPNHVPESVHVSNYDTVPRAGIVNNVPVSTTTTTTITTTASPSSSSSSCSSSTSSSTSTSSASSSLSYSFSSSSSASSCSSSSSLQIPCSPSKLQQQQQVVGPYTGMERGVPEGAASVTGHDMPQSGILLGSNSYVGHNPSGVSLPNHAQNSVYYAMNV